MKLKLLPAAEAEIVEAALWYEERGLGLGRRFTEEVGKTIDAIQRSPGRFPLYEAIRLKKPTRRARVSRFPYYAFYRLNEKDDVPIVVVAVSHARRRPGYWAGRS